MKTIFLFVDKPTFIGDLLKTNYLPYLASKYRVVVFTRKLDAKMAIAGGWYQSPNVIYIKWQTENDRLFSAMKFLRFSCIREFDYLTTVQHFRKRRGQDENKALLRVLSRPFSFLLTSNFFYNLERWLIKKSPKFSEYCRQYWPSLVLTATPGLNNFEAEAILLAKKYGITSVAVNCAWDNLTTRVTRVRSTDYFLAWHEPMRREAIEIHKYNSEKAFVTGPIRFDYYVVKDSGTPSREEFLRSKNLNPSYKTILYTTQKSHVFEERFLNQLIDLREKRLIPYTNIFIRIHPLTLPNRFKEFSGRQDIHLERPSEIMSDQELLNLKHTLLHTDLNINYSSTLSLEAALFDKPIINYFEPTLERGFELNHYRPLVDEGAVKLISDFQKELPAVIKEYLENPDSDRPKRKKIADLYFPFRDGLSYKRSVDFLEKIIENGE